MMTKIVSLYDTNWQHKDNVLIIYKYFYCTAKYGITWWCIVDPVMVINIDEDQYINPLLISNPSAGD